MPQSKTKTCQNCHEKFRIELEDFEFYRKMDVPEPTFCPECRMQRRMTFRNEIILYKRKCDFSGKEVFSMFSPEASVRVYDHDIWISDQWNPIDYGQEYDFERPFFKQFEELTENVPLPSRAVKFSVNSDYSMNAGHLKNCYLIFDSRNNDNCAYGYRVNDSRDCYNNSLITECELCQQNFMTISCYKTFYSSNCADCQGIYFCKDCINCQNCLGCANLRHKKYHIFNKPYTKQEYEKKLKEFDLGSFRNIQELNNQARTLWLKHPVKFMHGRKNVNVSGDYIYNSKNVLDCYSIKDGENMKYCQSIDFKDNRDCYDHSSWGNNIRSTYEICGAGGGINKLVGCFNCYSNVRDSEYCFQCHSSSSDLFGCISLSHKHHCILNKQYTKSSFDKLRTRIIEHMNEMPYVDKKGRIYKYGEFFPVELSPFAYNETIAQEYFPLTKEQAIEQGYSWYDKPKPEYQPTLQAKDLPDNIKDVDKSILKEVIQCGSLETKFPKETRFPSSCAGSGVFRIIPQEYEFYRKMNLPLPRLCPDCRHRERIKQRNPMKLWERQCMNKGCSNTFQTTYAPDRKEIVYCEACYNKAVG